MEIEIRGVQNPPVAQTSLKEMVGSWINNAVVMVTGLGYLWKSDLTRNPIVRILIISVNTHLEMPL